mmetsp:Transcript_4225/g.14692  ORF Transcript_4225/g.14692 Transcript_4225/m.14692 type:complete len:257 (-) Transcript_4225:126-896(-)
MHCEPPGAHDVEEGPLLSLARHLNPGRHRHAHKHPRQVLEALLVHILKHEVLPHGVDDPDHVVVVRDVVALRAAADKVLLARALHPVTLRQEVRGCAARALAPAPAPRRRRNRLGRGRSGGDGRGGGGGSRGQQPTRAPFAAAVASPQTSAPAPAPAQAPTALRRHHRRARRHGRRLSGNRETSARESSPGRPRPLRPQHHLCRLRWDRQHRRSRRATLRQLPPRRKGLRRRQRLVRATLRTTSETERTKLCSEVP